VALAEALTARRISGAGIRDDREPPAAHSPLWGIEHVATIPRTAGEARRYDDKREILRDDLGGLWRDAKQ
jgi:phosphoglycerate dehydrogenase-like enzyme